jgi:hypothetical protein
MKTKQIEMELGVKFVPPKLVEVIDWGFLNGLPTHECEKFFSYHSAGGWTIGRHKMKSWRDALNYWRLNWIQGQSKEEAKSKRTVYNLKNIIEANQKIADQIKRSNSYEVATGRKWHSELARGKYRAIIEHIKELNEELAAL